VSPRRSAADARQTRAAILARGVAIASVEGLEGLTIGRLADELAMSKSGVLGQFGSKQGLQLAVVDAAAALFAEEVSDRARGTDPGLPRLLALCEAWISYLERGVFPGGCFFAAVSGEFDDRTGPVRNAIIGLITVWHRDLRQNARLAIAAGELPADADADQIVFELTGQMLALNHAFRLYRDHTAPDRTRRAMGRLLGHPLPALALQRG
jgi:AcrR family transcriptional regulator